MSFSKALLFCIALFCDLLINLMLQMFGTVEASEEVVAHGSPSLAREVRQPSAPPTSNPAETTEKGMNGILRVL